MKSTADIAMIGLAVMGRNLILNMADKGFSVACYNRTTSKVDSFLQEEGNGRNLIGCHDLAQVVTCLKSPRKIMLMVRAGQAVDELIDDLVPLLAPGDIIIDGGNSHFSDTMRRSQQLTRHGMRFVGAGISGGETGARLGPSIMPGGHAEAWPAIKPIFQAIAARAPDGRICCDWIGPDGAGHFVKMVHNGIEYADMQLIAEAYHLMAQGLTMSPAQMHKVFLQWNAGELESYLIEITADILTRNDPETGQPLIDTILDAAAQKGTGKWTTQSGLDLGVGIPQIAEAVFARALSAVKTERIKASTQLGGPARVFDGHQPPFLDHLQSAVHASKICAYAQGFDLLRAASQEYGWPLNFGQISLIWRAGCIIRARLLDEIATAFEAEPALPNLLLSDAFKNVITQAQTGWRQVAQTAIDLGIPVPSLTAALSYYDAYRCARLPANLLQAQRDYFGAHTYERIDQPRGVFFHTDWTGR